MDTLFQLHFSPDSAKKKIRAVHSTGAITTTRIVATI